MVEVEINHVSYAYQEGTPYLTIAKERQKDYDADIVLVKVNGKLQELHKRLKKNCRMEMITTKDPTGFKTLRRSMQLLLIKSIYDVAGHNKVEDVLVHFAVSKGVYVEVLGEVVLDEKFLLNVKERMLELARQDLPIQKRTVSTDEAIEIFGKHKMHDKENLFKYRRVSKVNIYSINEFEDYYYGYMVNSTRYLKYFELYLYDKGLVLQMPEVSEPEIVPPFEPSRKVFDCLKESTVWSQRLGIHAVGALNDKIVKGELNDLILIQEALMEKKLAEIAGKIEADSDIKFVMIAGPSSSGKTTFSHRLSIQLKALGLTPHPIAVDDYFVNRENSPLDEFGNYNYEALECIDMEQFNQDMTDLLNGKEVELPTYNFKTGKREYKGRKKKLEKEDILVIEGIHCLNDRLSYSLPAANKFRIYISALTQLNIDEHNRIPTTDGRLIRRMVRDARTRGTGARETIAMWPSVRRGEEENIFPYQDLADVVFNSALIYEFSVLKTFAEPLLFGIPKDAPEYGEAKKLLKFFDYFLPVDTENIPKNSLIREFIGGSCFHV